ncbi:MAG TPA: hypothetical protein VFT62_07445 [Mycobacteriales bacterium]|nr:hypothetical protein [Mycobacteriales bacterium]
MSELDDRIARLQQLLAANETDNDVLTQTLKMLRQLRAEMRLAHAD